MFRKMMMALAAAGLMVPLSAGNAEASDFSVRVGVGSGHYGGYHRYPGHWHERDACYHVYYRPCGHHRWRLYETYHSHSRAHRVERWLEHNGHDARVVHR